MKKIILTTMFLLTGCFAIQQLMAQSKIAEDLLPAEDASRIDELVVIPQIYKLETNSIPSAHKRSVSDDYLQKLDSLEYFVKDENTGRMSKFLTNVFEFDDNNNMVMDEQKIFNEEFKARVAENKRLYAYDAENRLIEEITYWKDAVTLEWQPVSRLTKMHNQYGVPLLTEYRYDDLTGKWIAARKIERTFDANGRLLTAIRQIWDGSASTWKILWRRDWTYRSSDLPSEIKGYVWHEITSSWELDWILEYEYDRDDNLIKELHIEVTGMGWFSDWKHEYVYDRFGDIEFEYYSEWNDLLADFEFVWRDAYEYNGDRSVKSVIRSNYNRISQSWINERKTEFTFDNSIPGDALLYPFLYFNDPGDEEFFFRYKVENMRGFEWNMMSAEWDLINENIFHYSRFTTLTTDRVNQTLRVYPNPCDDILHVISESGATRSIDLRIYDLMGKQVMSTTMVGQEGIDVSWVPPGVYNCIVTVGDDVQSFRVLRQ